MAEKNVAVIPRVYGIRRVFVGLTFDERDIIEGAFRNGLLKVLTTMCWCQHRTLELSGWPRLERVYSALCTDIAAIAKAV